MSTISASTTSTTAYKVTADTTGTLVLQTGSTPTTAVTIDTAQNVGLGVVPTNNTLGKTLQVGQAGAWVAESGTNRWWLANNWYYNSGDKYINNGYATLYSQQNGSHQWQTAASGTAGNAISFTQAMTLDASGNLVLGTTNAAVARLYTKAAGATLAASFTEGAATGNIESADAGRVNKWTFGRDNVTTGNFVFALNGSTLASLDTSGNLLVGQTSTGVLDSSSFSLQGVGTSASIVINHKTGVSSGDKYAYFDYAGNIIGSITQNGTTAVAYNTSSDYRLKENVQPLTGALARIAELKPCTYTWKTAPDEIGEGFIAHELAEVCPHAVTGEKDAVDEQGNPIYQGIDTSFLVATLTAAIKEQQALITTLTERITALEGAK